MTSFWREWPRDRLEELPPLLESWDYIRPVPAEELEGSFVAGLVDDDLVELVALAWMMGGPTPESIALHACAARGRAPLIGTPRALQAAMIIGELLGARRLYSVLPLGAEARGVPSRAMRRYFRMRGWKQDDHGAYVDLGE